MFTISPIKIDFKFKFADEAFDQTRESEVDFTGNRGGDHLMIRFVFRGNDQDSSESLEADMIDPLASHQTKFARITGLTTPSPDTKKPARRIDQLP